MTLSHKWAARHHAILSRTTDDAIRLAVSLGVVKSAVRVVDRTLPPLAVDWASVDPDPSAVVRSMSYTDMQGHSIHINPMPILDRGMSHGQALDTVIGFGLHEASHSQESRDRHRALIRKELHPNGKSFRDVPAFTPMRVAAYLWNLVEDVRIESVTGGNWPGFVPYFGALLDYIWRDIKVEQLPTEYGPELKDKLRVAFLACRFPDRWVPKGGIGPFGKGRKRELETEKHWWRGWQEDYLSAAADTTTTIQRALDHLAEDEKTAQELTQMAEMERKAREAGERLRDQLERLINEGIDGAFKMCIGEQGEMRPLDAELADEVRKLVREGLMEHKAIITAQGAGNAPLYSRRPEETRESIRSFVGRPNAEAEALRAALVFRNSAPQHDVKLMRSGVIDDEELWRVGTGDFRVFSERIVDAKPDVFMGLLVDLSGSMNGKKLEIAQRLAQLFVWAVHDQEAVETAVWGHTADVGWASSSTDVYTIWQRGDPLTRLGLIQTLPHGNNADGHAIAHVADWIARNTEQPEKVLLVLSDGLPNAHDNYGGTIAQQHVRQVSRWAQMHGVRVIQLAIDPSGIRPAEQSAMFGEGGWIGFTSYAQLPRQITTLLGRFV